MKHKIYGNELANMPYEPRPEGCDSPLWRYSKNPVIGMNPFPNASRVFNSAVMAYKGEFIGVFRADTKNGIPFLFVGHSKDGLKFDFEVDPIVFHDKNGKAIKLEYAYDPRLVELEGYYYIIFCTSMHLTECLEHLFVLFFWNAAACVGHQELMLVGTTFLVFQRDVTILWSVDSSVLQQMQENV